MIPSGVRNTEDPDCIVEERNAKSITIAVPEANGLLRTKFISRDKLFSVLKNSLRTPPVVLAVDFGDIKLCSFFEHA